MKTATIRDSMLPEMNEAIMKEAIWRSGYLLERRVATLLGKAGCRTITNRAFIDPETIKSREYDVYAYKDVTVFNNGSYGIYPTLICECKNNLFPIAFFVQDDETFEPLQDEVRVSGIPSRIWVDDKYISLQEFTRVESFHHYCMPKVPVATQCCTFEMKRDRSSLMASHGEDLYETFRTLIKALEYEINEDYKNMSQWFLSEEKEKTFIDLSFYYPTVIFQGDIYAVHVDKEHPSEKNDLKLEKCEHIQYNPEFFSFYDNEVVSYHMDVISERYLPTYLKIIEGEMLTVKQIIQQKKREVIFSVKKIVEQCENLKKKPSNYRKFLDFNYYV